MEKFNEIVSEIDGYVWGIPLIVMIMFCGLLLTIRVGLLQIRKLGLALKYMFKDEEGDRDFGIFCDVDLDATQLEGEATFSYYNVGFIEDLLAPRDE
jgi:hypothetical protein